MLLSIRALPGGKIALGGQLFASCGIGAITGETTLDADGNFALRGVVKRNPLVRVSQTTSFLVRGKLTAAGGDGTAKMTLRVTAKGQKAESCSSRTVNWTVRRPIDTAAVPAPAPGEATLYGLTSQTGGRTKHAIVLHAASAGRRIERLSFGFRSKCSRGRIIAADDVNISPEFDVAADGSFREVERFRVNFSDVDRAHDGRRDRTLRRGRRRERHALGHRALHQPQDRQARRHVQERYAELVRQPLVDRRHQAGVCRC